jgi:ABC-type uncharacterized transport system permease subunit
VRRPRTLAELSAGTASLLLTLGGALLSAVLLILLLSRAPLTAIRYFFLGPFGSRYALGSLLSGAVPLVLTGLGMAVAFRSSVFNLGGEGQLYAGALAATVVMLALPGQSGYVGGAAALAVAVVTGAALAGLSGFLRMRWGTDELISSFLISAAVLRVVSFLITGPLSDPASNLQATRPIPAQYWLSGIFPPSRLSTSALFALVAAGLVFFLLYYTRTGYEMRMCGLNREFARYGGIDVSAYLLTPMLLSGALHGLAGGLSIMGTYHVAVKEFSAGLGWNGIAVALIAGSHPLAVLPAALFLAYIEAGAREAMLHSDVSLEIAAIVQAVIFFLVTARALARALRPRGVEARPGRGA